MENYEETEPVQQDNETEMMVITEDIRSYIYETAKWARFLSIVGFVFCGLIIIGAFSMSAVMSAMTAIDPSSPIAKVGAGVLTVIYLLIGLLYFYPSLLLFKYAKEAKTAVLYGDQASLSAAMAKMKSFFKFWGILTIVIIGFYAMAILFGIVVGIGANIGA